MKYAFRKALARKIDIQPVAVPADAKPVAFLNRAGDPTVYFLTAKAKDAKPQRTARLVLTDGESPVPDGAVYIGTAEFSGGQLLYHAWELPNA